MIKKLLFILFFLSFCIRSVADFTELKFSTKDNALLYNQITHELRCLVCQNQSIAESDAALAVQLKKEIYNKIEAGVPQQQIFSYITQRYGEFVLFTPTFSVKNLFLWLAPGFFLLFGLIILYRKLK